MRTLFVLLAALAALAAAPPAAANHGGPDPDCNPLDGEPCPLYWFKQWVAHCASGGVVTDPDSCQPGTRAAPQCDWESGTEALIETVPYVDARGGPVCYVWVFPCDDHSLRMCAPASAESGSTCYWNREYTDHLEGPFLHFQDGPVCTVVPFPCEHDPSKSCKPQ